MNGEADIAHEMQALLAFYEACGVDCAIEAAPGRNEPDANRQLFPLRSSPAPGPSIVDSEPARAT